MESDEGEALDDATSVDLIQLIDELSGLSENSLTWASDPFNGTVCWVDVFVLPSAVEQLGALAESPASPDAYRQAIEALIERVGLMVLYTVDRMTIELEQLPPGDERAFFAESATGFLVEVLNRMNEDPVLSDKDLLVTGVGFVRSLSTLRTLGNVAMG